MRKSCAIKLLIFLLLFGRNLIFFPWIFTVGVGSLTGLLQIGINFFLVRKISLEKRQKKMEIDKKMQTNCDAFHMKINLILVGFFSGYTHISSTIEIIFQTRKSLGDLSFFFFAHHIKN